MNRTIVANKSEIKKLGLKQYDLISVDMLMEYGFDMDIIKGLIEYEIWPDIIKLVDGDGSFNYFAIKSQVFGIANRFMHNELGIYKAVTEKEKLVEESRKYLEDNKIKIEPEDMKRIESGEITLIELLETKEKANTPKPTKTKKAKKTIEVSEAGELA